MSKPVSEKQRRANRQNAQKSTGPKTPEGKAQSSRNALKHGLLAKEVVITQGDGAETQADFDALLADLLEEFQPQGFIEESLVERVATCYWRLRRAQRFETGAIRQNLDYTPEPGPDPEADSTADFERLFRFIPERQAIHRRLAKRLEQPPDLKDPETFEELMWTLSALGLDPEYPGLNPPRPPNAKEIRDAAADGIDLIAEGKAELDRVHKRYLEDLDRLSPDPAEFHAALRKTLERIIEQDTADIPGMGRQLVDKYQAAEERRWLARSRTPLIGAIPAEADLKKLIRYETMIDRQLHRALTELTHRQSTRQRAQLGAGTPRHRARSAGEGTTLLAQQAAGKTQTDQTNPSAERAQGAPSLAQQGVGNPHRPIQ